MKYMKRHIRNLILIILLYAGLLVFLLSTNPNKLSVSWLIIPFVWLFVALLCSARLAIDVFRSPSGRHLSKRQLSVAAVCAAIPTVMLLLDSINQLTIKDSLLIGALGIGALFYITKIHLKTRIS